MFDSKNPRDNPLNWSFGVGRAFGIAVRVHVFFLIWIAIELLRDIANGSLLTGAVFVTLLFAIVLLHEFGHCFGARAVGGHASDILMWPLGGLATVQAPMTPRSQFVTVAAGPAVNVVGCLLSAGVLLVLGGGGHIALNPLALTVPGTPPMQWTAADWIGIVWVINYALLLFNLLPTFPMDGGRLLHIALWSRQGYGRALLTATFVGMVGAVVYGIIGLATDNTILLGLAIFGYVTCMRERHVMKYEMTTGGPFDGAYEFDVPLDSAAQRPPSWFARRRTRKLAEQAERERRRAADIERAIDAILDKVHREGIHALSAREKKLLADATAKHRDG